MALRYWAWCVYRTYFSSPLLYGISCTWSYSCIHCVLPFLTSTVSFVSVFLPFFSAVILYHFQHSVPFHFKPPRCSSHDSLTTVKLVMHSHSYCKFIFIFITTICTRSRSRSRSLALLLKSAETDGEDGLILCSNLVDKCTESNEHYYTLAASHCSSRSRFLILLLAPSHHLCIRVCLPMLYKFNERNKCWNDVNVVVIVVFDVENEIEKNAHLGREIDKQDINKNGCMHSFILMSKVALPTFPRQLLKTLCSIPSSSSIAMPLFAYIHTLYIYSILYVFVSVFLLICPFSVLFV